MLEDIIFVFVPATAMWQKIHLISELITRCEQDLHEQQQQQQQKFEYHLRHVAFLLSHR